MTKTEAAIAALAMHDALRAVVATEPPLDVNGWPDDPEGWLAWYKDEREPAYARWSTAMDDLDAALGEKVGRHPFTFRPVCEAIIEEGS